MSYDSELVDWLRKSFPHTHKIDLHPNPLPLGHTHSITYSDDLPFARRVSDKRESDQRG